MVKNNDGEVVKFAPVRVTTAHSISVVSHPDPDSKQLILGHEYEIEVSIYNKEGRKIHPSPVCKSSTHTHKLGSHLT